MMRRRFLDVRVVAQDWVLPSLPEAFEGFRLLQLTDLHCDLDPALTAVVADLIRLCPHDAAVITGDFRNGMGGNHEVCIRETRHIVETLNPQRWGILGNHDFIEMVPELESMGLPILLNEVTEVRRGSASIWIGGIDDPHFYQTHDLAEVRARIPREGGAFWIGGLADYESRRAQPSYTNTLAGVPDNEPIIVLSHWPDPFAAAPAKVALTLAGHSHCGQVNLPLVGRLVHVSPGAERWPCGLYEDRGGWLYVSGGVGTSILPVRFNQPPEIAVLTLRGF